MSTEMQLILYGILVVILGIVGYYVGAKYVAVGEKMGAGIGVVTGLVISGAIWYSMKEEMF